jgi:hypothetical protein
MNIPSPPEITISESLEATARPPLEATTGLSMETIARPPLEAAASPLMETTVEPPIPHSVALEDVTNHMEVCRSGMGKRLISSLHHATVLFFFE